MGHHPQWIEPIYAELGARLRILRKERRLTLKELSAELGVAKSTIVVWEQGTVRIAVSEVLLLARLFGVPIETLLGDLDVESCRKPQWLLAKRKGIAARRIATVHSRGGSFGFVQGKTTKGK